mmetsp:Transcript_2498/g.6293  ORF Transcript_2498/g.6293 Transcript_2498/m.6293 type:complete len:216 (+) Transcript_2498:2884-3531(+)
MTMKSASSAGSASRTTAVKPGSTSLDHSPTNSAPMRAEARAFPPPCGPPPPPVPRFATGSPSGRWPCGRLDGPAAPVTPAGSETLGQRGTPWLPSPRLAKEPASAKATKATTARRAAAWLPCKQSLLLLFGLMHPDTSSPKALISIILRLRSRRASPSWDGEEDRPPSSDGSQSPSSSSCNRRAAIYLIAASVLAAAAAAAVPTARAVAVPRQPN